MKEHQYTELANLNKDLLVSRRQIEWKICLAFWVGVIGLVGFIIRANVELGLPEYLGFCILLVIASGVFTYWHISLNGSNRKDLDLIIYFRERAEVELGNASLNPKRPTEDLKLSAFRYALKHTGYINCFLPHIIVTAIILVGAILILITHFHKIKLVNDNFEFPDLLGAAYEYLIKFFADSSGKKGGQFYTPSQVVRLLVNLIRPQQGMSIYDPTAGSGGMLIQSYQYVEDQGQNPSDLEMHGQELDPTVVAI